MKSKKLLIITKAFVQKPLIQTNNRKLFIYDEEQACYTREKGKKLKQISSEFFDNIDLYSYKEIEEMLMEQKYVEDLNSFDYIISVGGDGTFLTCGHLIDNNRQILLGVNSNPSQSVGFLCQIPFEEDTIRKTMKRIREEDFRILKRKRYTIDLFNAENEKEAYFFGLNEVFLSSRDTSSTFRYDFKFDGQQLKNLRSTACIIYTGTGSTGWARSMKLMTKTQIRDVLSIHDPNVSEEQVLKTRDLYNKKIEMHPAYEKMRFLHREMFDRMINHQHEGEGTEFEIVNRSINGFMAFDGYYYDLKLHDKVVIKISDEDKDLSCFDFNYKY
jgi:NAD kinase